MSVSLKLSDELVGLAVSYAATGNRTVAQQIEFWARLGKAAHDYPELPLQFLKETLLATDEAKTHPLAPYPFGSGK